MRKLLHVSIIWMTLYAGGAGIISGVLTDDAGHPLAGIPVSDGIAVAFSDANGRYRLEFQEGQPFVFVHCPRGLVCRDWFVRRPESGNTYDFVFSPVPERGFLLQISDTETDQYSWVKPFAQYRNCPPDFLIHTGDLCWQFGIVGHARELNEETVGYPVYYAPGNHDIVAPWDDGKNYPDYLQPYYYSFEWLDYLVIVAPMHGGDVALPYRMEDFVQWLRQLTGGLPPDRPILVFSHDTLLADFSGPVLKAGNFEFDFGNRLAGWAIGHWHYNFCRRDPVNGTRLWGTAVPQKGGIDHSAAAYRMIYPDGDGKLTSRLIWGGLEHYMCLALPSAAMRLEAGDGTGTVVSSVVWHSGPPVATVTVAAPGMEPVRLSVNGMSWNGTVRFPSGATEMTLEAKCLGGETFRRDFSIHPAPAPKKEQPELLWMGLLDGECQFTRPVIADGLVFTASIDDHNGETAGIYALDIVNGERRWKFTTGNSVRNTIVCVDGVIYAQDVTGSLYAINAGSGQLRWQIPGNPLALKSAVANGIAVADGVVYSGFRENLSARNAEDGSLRWANTEWNAGNATTNTIAVSDGVLATAGNWSMLTAFDAATGRQIWKHTDDITRFQSASALFHDGKLFAKAERAVQVFDPRDGTLLLQKEVKVNLHSAGAMAIAGNLLIVPTAEDGMLAFDCDTLEQVWHFSGVGPALVDTAPYRTRAGTVDSSPEIRNDVIYFGAGDGMIYALDAATGMLRWKLEVGAPVMAPVTIADGILYAGDFSGRIFAWRLADAEQTTNGEIGL